MAITMLMNERVAIGGGGMGGAGGSGPRSPFGSAAQHVKDARSRGDPVVRQGIADLYIRGASSASRRSRRSTASSRSVS